MRALKTILIALALLWTNPSAAEGPHQEKTHLAAGQFLLASPHLRDPNFYQTVVLLMTYGPEGASGLIVNRPTDIPLGRALPHVDGIEKVSEPVYFGGPVGTNRLVALLRSDTPLPDSKNVLDRIYFTASMKNLTDALQGRNPDEIIRIYAGYSGWAPKQLDSEFARGDWVTITADPNAIFSDDPSKIWPNFFESQQKIEIRLPELNAPFRSPDIGLAPITAILSAH